MSSYRVEVRDTPTAPWSELLRSGDQGVAERAAQMAVMRKGSKIHKARVTVGGLAIFEVTAREQEQRA